MSKTHCHKCGQPKTPTASGKLLPYCRLHWNEWRRNNYKERGEYARKRDSRTHANWIRRKQYGITIDQYDKLLESQGGVCAICKRTNIGGRRMAVDHDHSTGKIRGILCDKCNRGMGFLDEDISRFEACIKYLKVADR